MVRFADKARDARQRLNHVLQLRIEIDVDKDVARVKRTFRDLFFAVFDFDHVFSRYDDLFDFFLQTVFFDQVLDRTFDAALAAGVRLN